MITLQLIKIFSGLVNFLLSILPTADAIPSEINQAFSLVAGFFKKANAIFPVDTTFTIIGMIITIEAGILVFKVANWGINKIRGAG